MANRFDDPVVEPENPWMPTEASYPMAPARTIVITDDIRAQDAAEQAARGCAPEHPWAAVKASLQPGVLITRPHGDQQIVIGVKRECRGCSRPIWAQSKTGYCMNCLHERQTAAKPKAAAKAVAKVSVTTAAKPLVATLAALETMAVIASEHLQEEPTEPPTQQETTTMSVQTTCACGKPLSDSDIAKGRTHAWGHANGCPKPKAAKKAASPKPISDAPPSVTTTIVAPAASVVMLPIPTAALDAYWSKLSDQEKGRIVANELLRYHGLSEIAHV